MACSLARMPKAMVVEGPTWANAVCRTGVAPDSPVYQNTVLAGVPATSDVEDAGAPLTRSGGFELKKSLAAAIAEAAGNAVCARLAIAPDSAVCRLPAGALGLAPRLTETDGGELDVMVEPVKFEVMLATLKPNGDVAESSASDTLEPD